MYESIWADHSIEIGDAMLVGLVVQPPFGKLQ